MSLAGNCLGRTGVTVYCWECGRSWTEDALRKSLCPRCLKPLRLKPKPKGAPHG